MFNRKRVLLLLVLVAALGVYFASTVGTTYAFNSVTQDERLEVSLHRLSSEEAWVDIQNGSTQSLFSNTSNWEPGGMYIVPLKVNNSGSSEKNDVTFDYLLYPTSTKHSSSADLAEVIDVYVYNPTAEEKADNTYKGYTSPRPTLTPDYNAVQSPSGWIYLGRLCDLNSLQNSSTLPEKLEYFENLACGQSTVHTLLFKMREEADNTYKSCSIDVHITLLAIDSDATP